MSVPTWTLCWDCLARHGSPLGSDVVAQVHGRTILTTLQLSENPALIWLEFATDGEVWALCRCGWSPAATLIVAWHKAKGGDYEGDDDGSIG